MKIHVTASFVLLYCMCFRWRTLSLIVEVKIISSGISCKIHFTLSTTKVTKVHVVLALFAALFRNLCLKTNKALEISSSRCHKGHLLLVNISPWLVTTPPARCVVLLLRLSPFKCLKSTAKYQFYLQKWAGSCKREQNSFFFSCVS